MVFVKSVFELKITTDIEISLGMEKSDLPWEPNFL